MTSDAKIGLLLGLVFIFIIAFVINGLPRFRSATNNNSELTDGIINPAEDSLGIAERERRVQETFDLHGRFASDTARSLSPVTDDNVNVGYEAPLPEETLVAFNDNQDDVRFTMPLTQNASVMEESPIEEPVHRAETVPSVESLVQTPVKKPKPVRPAKPKAYIVQEGDGNLSNIAKKFYGEIEGNRLVNVTRIFEANRNVLKSADEIFVGQKLVIPSLSGSSPEKSKSEGIFSRGLFEKVKSIGRSSEKTRIYTVKEGDSLWTIAAEQLGQGARYKELSKLNDDIIPNEDSLRAGMRLRLPVK
jgi:nucleoid-associated protein YgaU